MAGPALAYAYRHGLVPNLTASPTALNLTTAMGLMRLVRHKGASRPSIEGMVGMAGAAGGHVPR